MKAENLYRNISTFRFFRTFRQIFKDETKSSLYKDLFEKDVHPDARKPLPPEFEGDVNPKTGEIGGFLEIF
ncbi:hypothetical protein PORY_002533 [Pneumocystis oryctolagi]|uniref:Uncharacterized protein n=1 Tax=Pneumocystis oryctolagi TaxID=42067 RepID=A0ACB7C9A3_9ASCO|nr:hypothetical protein PORY_002533 [Pneumocystis oryctolagi]